jgi:hypothetical protein
MSLRFGSGVCSHPECKNRGEQLLANMNRKLCIKHNQERLKEASRGGSVVNQKLRKSKIKSTRKPSGELELFKKIANTRPRFCEVCEKYIKELKVHNFAHILSKGSYPKLRLVEENILILCWDYGQGCHEKFDTKAHSDLENLPEWKDIFERKEFLKQKYYANNKT